MSLYERLAFKSGVAAAAIDYGAGWWEEGCLIVPAERWVEIKTQILALYAENQRWLYEKALEVYESVRRTKKRRQSWHAAFNCDPVVASMSIQLACTLRPLLFYAGNEKLYKPRVKDLLPGKWSDVEFEFSAGSRLILDQSTHVLRWSLRGATAKQIHTELPAVVKLFDYLADLPYLRGTGGVIRTKEGDLGFGPLGSVLIGT